MNASENTCLSLAHAFLRKQLRRQVREPGVFALSFDMVSFTVG